MFSKLIKSVLLTLLAYLLQATAAKYMAIDGVAPNIALALVAVVSISLGRKYTFLMSLTIGYFLEIMMPALDYINMVIYPVCAMLGALAFSDKSERRMEEDLNNNRSTKMLNPHLRVVLCAALSVAVFEGVNLIYIYLSGVTLNAKHIGRAILDVVYSMALAGVLQFPIRLWLGMYKKAAR